jgi:hypothetical protein
MTHSVSHVTVECSVGLAFWCAARGRREVSPTLVLITNLLVSRTLD